MLQVGALAGLGAVIRWQLDPTGGLLFEANRAFASVQVQQTPLSGSTVAQFVTPLTTFAGRRITDSDVRVGMFEIQQKLLPDSVYANLPDPFKRGSYVWAYAVNSAEQFAAVGVNGSRPSYPGVTVEATRGSATTIHYANNLPGSGVLRKYLTIDRTIHWADPQDEGHVFTPYTGPIPTVVHLHGGEDQSTSDGAPEAWFTNNGLRGPGYFSLRPTDQNAAVYQYPNRQQATTLWFHDHALGITRINVYSGMAAFYFIRDQFDTGRADNPMGLPAGNQEVELMLQDRQFDTNGQLLFPDSATNPSLVDGPPSNLSIHPFWIPEFFGDAMLVNGRTWPFLQVEPRRYRFRVVNSSNARFLRMGLVDATNGNVGPAMYLIGTDGGFLDRPVMSDRPVAHHWTQLIRRAM
jgi:FtsP/CotA-like multicopper oxidase with cupredoxin domain